MRDAALSNTYRGLLIAILGPIVARYGIDDAQVALIVEGLLALIGGVLAIYGRQTAAGPITHVVRMPLPQALIPAPKIEEPKP